MKEILVMIEPADTAFFAYSSEYGGVTAQGESLEEVKQAIDEEIARQVIERNVEMHEPYALKFQADLQGVFKLLPEINISSLAQHADMNPGLLRQYVSGSKRASEKQTEKVNQALAILADKINSVTIRKTKEPSAAKKLMKSLGLSVHVVVASAKHHKHAAYVCYLIAEAAKQRGTGIAKRTPEYIKTKMSEGKAVIALDGDIVAGFCYIESWEHDRYVANSGLIVSPGFRKTGLARKIKRRILELSREKFPSAKIFGITTSLAVMKINSDLGYRPVTFSELTDDEKFWQGCKGCVNYDILERTDRTHCLCTGMLYLESPNGPSSESQKQSRWEKFQSLLKPKSRK